MNEHIPFIFQQSATAHRDKCMHNCTSSLARSTVFSPFHRQQCSLCSWDKPAKVKPLETRQARGRSTPTVKMLTQKQSQSHWSQLWLRDAPQDLAEETTDPTTSHKQSKEATDCLCNRFLKFNVEAGRWSATVNLRGCKPLCLLRDSYTANHKHLFFFLTVRTTME